MTSAKFAACGLRGLNLATREGREGTDYSQHQHGDNRRTGSSLSSSLAALNSSMADGMKTIGPQNSALTAARARTTVQDIVKNAGSMLLATDLENRDRLVTIVEAMA